MQDGALADRFEAKVGLELWATYDAPIVLAQVNRRGDRGSNPVGGANRQTELKAPDRHRAVVVDGRQPAVKMSSGRKADTSMLGTSTTWLSFRSTATLQMA